MQESSARAVLLQWGSEVDFNLGETIWTSASHRVVTSEVRAMGALEVVDFMLKFGVINIGAGEAVEGGEVRHRSKCGGGLFPLDAHTISGIKGALDDLSQSCL